MAKKAVIDRYEGDYAVIVFEENDKKINYPKNNLPKGSKEGDWLLIDFQGDKIIKVSLDYQSKEDAKKRIAEKLEKLRNKGNK